MVTAETLSSLLSGDFKMLAHTQTVALVKEVTERTKDTENLPNSNIVLTARPCMIYNIASVP